MGQAIGFVVVGSVLVALAMLAFVQLGVLRFESALGRVRDGFPAGRRAPVWELPDTESMRHGTPSGTNWQLLLFGDHSLAEFRGVADGLKELARREPALEMLALCHTRIDFAEPGLRRLGLDLPVIPVPRRFYIEHNVRVMPFVMVLDADGVVRVNGVVNDEAGLEYLWRLACDGATFVPTRRSQGVVA